MYEQYFDDAIQAVSAWPDVEESDFPDLVMQQAILMSGHSDDFYLGTESDPFQQVYR